MAKKHPNHIVIGIGMMMIGVTLPQLLVNKEEVSKCHHTM